MRQNAILRSATVLIHELTRRSMNAADGQAGLIREPGTWQREQQRWRS